MDHLQWIDPLKMVIFHSYVSLPEGKWLDFPLMTGGHANKKTSTVEMSTYEFDMISLGFHKIDTVFAMDSKSQMPHGAGIFTYIWVILVYFGGKCW